MATNACSLTEGHCEPCRSGMPPLTQQEYEPLLKDLKSNWEVVDGKCLLKSYAFPNFMSAVAFVNRIAGEAEAEQHHPDLEVGWGKVVVRLWTHKIGGLSKNDFILAAKIDALIDA